MATRMVAIVCGVAMLSCISTSPAVKPHTPKAKTTPPSLFWVPLTEPDASRICIEVPFGPVDPCMTVGRLRRLVRETGAD